MDLISMLVWAIITQLFGLPQDFSHFGETPATVAHYTVNINVYGMSVAGLLIVAIYAIAALPSAFERIAKMIAKLRRRR